MPRPKKDGAPEPKRRSRNGCWPCKSRKVKCGEEKPQCLNCNRSGEKCDYSIRLNWEGRSRKTDDHLTGTWSITDGTHQSVSPAAFANARSPGNWNKATPSGPSSPATGTLSVHGNRSTPSNPSSPTPAMLNVFSGRDHPSPPALKSPPFLHPHSQQFHPPRKYPSPAASSIDSPGYNGNGSLKRSNSKHSPYPTAAMLPPQDMLSFNRQYSEQGQGEFDDRSKRRKLSPARDVYSPPMSFNGSNTSPYLTEARPSFTSNPMMPGPLTPSSEDGLLRQSMKRSPSMQPASLEEPRRMSVKSLLSNPDDDDSNDYGFRSEGNMVVPDIQSPMTYGLDQGLPDLDLPKNDDAHALIIVSPSLEQKHMLGIENEYDSPSYCEFGFGLTAKSPGFEKGGYYANPVPVKIPISLTPLPSLLTVNPMNLLYFHHFLNHTARILVPHDCEDNPFRKILPQLAISNINLLNLLLAYSASHRARLLNHREPSNRIAIWVRDVFPALRHALSSQEDQISDSTLATAIMLASLEIISPNVFEVNVSWQEHLKIARQMVIGRGGLKALRHRQDNVSYFLSRWFAYLDVVGSLSGTNYANADTNITALYDDDSIPSSADPPGQDYEIDCLLGFTSHCVTILAKVADLAKRCDAQRIAPDGSLRSGWQPTPAIVAEAERLKAALTASRAHTPKGCVHQHIAAAEAAAAEAQRPTSFSANGIPAATTIATDPSLLTDADELTATNHAFHAAGSIHLARRVLAQPTHAPEVQAAVRDIVSALERVRPGGTAEACLVFPMFTAGCEALDGATRRLVLERMRGVEGVGMAQVHKARTLMERVWATGKPWEALVAGEFFG